MRILDPSEASRVDREDTSSISKPLPISVIVPTYNQSTLLQRLLKSLSEQTVPHDDYEVIVAVDGSDDDSLATLEKLKADFKTLRVLNLTHKGPGAARNAGAEAARGVILAFTDDDCLASKDWLENILSVFKRTGAIAVQGKTTTDRENRSPLTHQMEVLSEQFGTLPTCNVSYVREAFVRVGGFDESFRFPHNEDADLAWRIEELGTIVFAPEVHIIHPPRRDSFWRRACWVQVMECAFLLYYKNPVKYKQYRNFSPWLDIYWSVFVVSQTKLIISSCKYLIRPIRPHFFLVGLMLVIARWINMIRFFPRYFKASIKCRDLFVKEKKGAEIKT